VATLFLEWNSDFQVTPSGSLQLAVGWDEVRQRIIRRVVTNPAQQLPDGTTTTPDYVFHPDYGIGLGAMVDQDVNDDFLRKVEGKITRGILQDASVTATSTPPSIQFYRPSPDTLWAVASVEATGTGPGIIQFAISKPAS
jgi:hypothetical protein